MTHGRPGGSFDETAALAELERLRESIQAARQARQRKSDEFDAFVKSFRTPVSAFPSERPGPATDVTAPPYDADPKSSGAPIPSPEPLADTVAVPPGIDTLGETAAPASPKASRPRKLNIRPLGVGAIVALVAVGLVSMRLRKQSSPPATVNPAPSTQVSTAPAETQAPTAPQTPSTLPAVAHGVVLEMRTVRPVWIRVVVDGRKSDERMFPAGESLQFTGEDSIVVRVGDGDAVLVKSGNREQRFGEEGQPLTRRFSKR